MYPLFMVNVLSSEWNDAEPCQLRTSVTMRKRLTRSRLRPRPVVGAVVGGNSAGRPVKQSDERPTETMLPAEKKASVLAGTWNSIQGSKPGLGQPNDGALPGWYETDLYAGASIELDKRWTVSGTYYRYVSPSACVIEREAKRGRLGRKPYFSLSWLGRNLEPERCALIIGPQVQRERPFTAIELTPPDQQFSVSRFIVVDRRNSL
jgi:hypothetical protein